MGSGWYEREHETHGFPFLDGRQRFELFAEQVEVVVVRGRKTGSTTTGPRIGCATSRRCPAATAAAPAARPRRNGQARFAALAARYATEVNTLGAPDEEPGAQAASSTVRARRPARSGDARLLRDDGVLPRRDGGDVVDRRRGSSRSAATTPIRSRSSRSAATAGSSARSTRSSNASKAFARSVSRASFLQHLNHDDDAMVTLVGDRLLSRSGSVCDMTTTELTGAEDVAGPLGPLRRRRRSTHRAGRRADRGGGGGLPRALLRPRRAAEPGELREAIEERERIESTFTRAIYYAHLWYSTDMNDRRAARSSRG